MTGSIHSLVFSAQMEAAETVELAQKVLCRMCIISTLVNLACVEHATLGLTNQQGALKKPQHLFLPGPIFLLAQTF